MSSTLASQLVIVAGGKGTRLTERTGNLPKPMIEIGGKPLIEHQVRLAQKYGISNVLVLTGFGAEHIEEYLGRGEQWSLRISYCRETTPLGSAGAVLNAFEALAGTFLLVYGDTMLNVDLPRMAAVHNDAAATLLIHPNDHPHDSDLIEIDQTDRVIAIHSYPHPSQSFFPNLVNAGLYIFSKQALASIHARRDTFTYPLDFGKHLFPLLLSEDAKLCGYLSREYIKDAGTPSRLDSVRHDYETGRVQLGSFESPAPTIFLDRDGTLSSDPGWIRSPEQIALLPGAAEAVRAVNQSGRLAVLVTNQPVVARGECSEAELGSIHNKLEWLLGQDHAYLDRIYYCPHHPDRGFPGERADLRIECACRKPKTGLFERAVRELSIDMAQSWMIGDSSADIEAAAACGIRSLLVRSNQREFASLRDVRPTAQFDNVFDAVQFVLDRTRVHDHHSNAIARQFRWRGQ